MKVLHCWAQNPTARLKKIKNSTVDDTPEPPLSAPPPLLLPLPLPMASGSFMYASDTLKVAELIRWW